MTKKLSQNNYIFLVCIGLMSTVVQPIDGHTLTMNTPIQEGALIQGTLPKGERLFLNETEIIPHTNGVFYFGLPQDVQTPLTLTHQTPLETKTITFPILKRSWQEQHINGLPQSKVQFSQKNKQRIQNENAQLYQQRTRLTTTFFPTCFIRPVQKPYRISGHFGNRRIFNQQIKAGHSGTDYAQPINTPVIAIADGKVALTHEDMFLSGKTILIDHGYGLFASYSHLNRIDVQAGQTVKQGQIIGKIGQTGRATGPHLHFTFTWHNTRLDPEYVFDTFNCITK